MYVSTLHSLEDLSRIYQLILHRKTSRGIRPCINKATLSHVHTALLPFHGEIYVADMSTRNILNIVNLHLHDLDATQSLRQLEQEKEMIHRQSRLTEKREEGVQV